MTATRDFFAGYDVDRIAHLRDHVEHMRRCDRAEITMRRRVEVMSKLADRLGHDPADATFDELYDWQGTLPNPGMIRWRTAMIRPYYAHLRARGYRNDDPSQLLPMPRRRRTERRAIPDDDLFRAVGTAPMPVLAFLLLAGWCGLRATEIAGLHREHLIRNRADVLEAVVTGKGGHQRRVPVPEWIHDTVTEQLPGAGPLFVHQRRPHRGKQIRASHVTDNVASYLKNRGVRDRLHSLRHRVATAVMHDTHDVRVVQELLGHNNLSALHVYTHVAPGEVAEAVNRLPRPGREAAALAPTGIETVVEHRAGGQVYRVRTTTVVERADGPRWNELPRDLAAAVLSTVGAAASG